MKKKEYQELEATLHKIEKVLEMSDYLKYAFFWRGDNGNAEQRAKREEELQASAEWDEGGHHYYADIYTSQSRSYTRVYRDYRKDNISTNLTPLKNSYKRLKAIYDAETEKRRKRETNKAS